MDRNNNNRIQTLVRGKKAEDYLTDEKILSIIDDGCLSTEEKLLKIQKKTETNKFGDYSDACFSVTFRTTKPIALTSLGFFGPYDRNTASYRVKCMIYELSSLSRDADRNHVAGIDIRHVVARQSSVFYVDLNEPLHCKAKSWYRIEFMVNGPITCVCRKVFCDYKQPGGLSFDFHASSNQMPEMKYFLL